MARQILHAHRDGRWAALDHPQAVVVDYDAQMIRVGLERIPVGRPQVWRFATFLLRSADLLQPYPSIGAAMGNPAICRGSLTNLASAARKLFAQIGMDLEMVYGVGYRLHTEPKESRKCTSPAHSLPRLKPARSTGSGPAARRTTCARSPARSTTSSAR